MALVDLVKRFFTALTGSKKATAFVLGLVFLFLTPYLLKVGVEVTPEEKNNVKQLLIAYLVAQGIADLGKGKAQVEAAAVEPFDTEVEDLDPPPGVTSGTVG